MVVVRRQGVVVLLASASVFLSLAELGSQVSSSRAATSVQNEICSTRYQAIVK